MGGLSHICGVPIRTYVFISLVNLSRVHIIIRPAKRTLRIQGSFFLSGKAFLGQCGEATRSLLQTGASRAEGFVHKMEGKWSGEASGVPREYQKTVRFYIAWHVYSHPHCALLRIIAENKGLTPSSRIQIEAC